MIGPQWYAGMIGVIMPPFVQMVIKHHWSRRQKSLMAILFSVLVGLGSAYFSGKFDVTDILSSISAVFAISQVVYDQFWKSYFQKKETEKSGK